jgi:hypothetical protein
MIMKVLLTILILLLLTAAAMAQTATADNKVVTVSNAGSTPIFLSGTVPANYTIQFQTAPTCGICAAPAHGSISPSTGATGVVSYSPTSGYTGPDSFEYQVVGTPVGGGSTITSAKATVTITVTNAKTTVTGTLRNPDGSPRSGKITWILTQAAASSQGMTPAMASVSATLDVNGAFTVQLYPSTYLQPQSYYQAWYSALGTSNQALRRELLGIYEIPPATGSVDFSAARVIDAALESRFAFCTPSCVRAILSEGASGSLPGDNTSTGSVVLNADTDTDGNGEVLIQTRGTTRIQVENSTGLVNFTGTQINIGTAFATSGLNFNLCVGNSGTKPCIRYNGTLSEWQYSNNGTAYRNFQTLPYADFPTQSPAPGVSPASTLRMYWDGATFQCSSSTGPYAPCSFGGASAGVSSLQGLAGVLTLNIGATGTAPAWAAASGVITLNLPDAGQTITRGLITNATQQVWGEKLLMDGARIFAGAGGNPVEVSSFINQSGTNSASHVTFRTISTVFGGPSFQVVNSGNVVIGGAAALATTATDGFLYLPVLSGSPTGIPTFFTNRGPLAVESDTVGGNYRVWGYLNGAWRNLSGGGSGAAGSNGQLTYNNAGTAAGLSGSSVSGSNLTLGGTLTLSTLAANRLVYTGTGGLLSVDAGATTNFSTSSSPDLYTISLGSNGGADGTTAAVNLHWYGTTGLSGSNAGNLLRLYRYRGTPSAPVAVNSNDTLGGIEFFGYEAASGLGSVQGAAILARAVENWGLNPHGAALDFYTTIPTITTLVQTVRMDHDTSFNSYLRLWDQTSGAFTGGLRRSDSNDAYEWSNDGTNWQNMDQPRSLTFSNLGTPANANFRYCSDCQVTSGADNTCTSGGSGAFAMRINGAWRCFALQN